MMLTFSYQISIGFIWIHVLLLLLAATKLCIVNAFLVVATEYHPSRGFHRRYDGPNAIVADHQTKQQQPQSINNGITIKSKQRQTIRYMNDKVKGRTTSDDITIADATTTTTMTASKSEKRNSTKTKKKRKKVVPKDPLHWIDDSDEFIIQSMYDNQSCHSDRTNLTTTTSNDDIGEATPTNYVRFKIRGNPLPLRRHRTSRGFMYNPSALAQASFRQMVEQLVYNDTSTLRKEDDDLDSHDGHTKQPRRELQLEGRRPVPLFNGRQRLVVSILFCMKRPKSHFRNSIPGIGRLKNTAPTQLAPTRTDVDNLAKFVLDSLNELLYDDDRQIISLHVTKILDNDHVCMGSTEVCIQAITDDNDNYNYNEKGITIEKVIQNSFTICSTKE